MIPLIGLLFCSHVAVIAQTVILSTSELSQRADGAGENQNILLQSQGMNYSL